MSITLPSPPSASTQRSTPTWFGAVPSRLVDRARRVAGTVANRLGEVDEVEPLVLRADEQSEHPNGWYRPSFAHGHAGIAALHAQLAGTCSSTAARALHHERASTFIKAAADATHEAPLSGVGIFVGTSGLALCVEQCAAAEPRYAGALAGVHHHLAEQVLTEPLATVEGDVADVDYDLVTGPAGALVQLCSVVAPTAVHRNAVQRLTRHLTWFGQLPEDPSIARRWLTRPTTSASLALRADEFTDGFLNAGLAHGAPAVMAALAAAYRAGDRSAEMIGSIEAISRWLEAIAQGDAHGPVWPSGVKVDRDGREQRELPTGEQVAWCYGSAGIATALLVTAQALGDPGLEERAVHAFDAVLERAQHHSFRTPTLCHGLAGILVMTLEFAARSSSRLAPETATALLGRLLDEADPDAPLVYADHEMSGRTVDSPSVLIGATGVALALLAATSPARPTWLRAFVLR